MINKIRLKQIYFRRNLVKIRFVSTYFDKTNNQTLTKQELMCHLADFVEVVYMGNVVIVHTDFMNITRGLTNVFFAVVVCMVSVAIVLLKNIRMVMDKINVFIVVVL